MPIAMPPAFRNDNNSTAHPPSTSFSPSFAAATTATTEAFTFPNTYIQRSRPYLTAAQIDSLRPKESRDEARTIQARLNACGWIVQVAQVLQFPVRTMATAMILYHRLLLFNKNSYLQDNWTEASAAALFVACKIEDTLKKSREILTASYNLRHPQSDPINPDSPLLEESAKRVISIERSILESSSFDFRYRHAQPFLIKFCRRLNVDVKISRRSWEIALDAYRTLAPLRAPPHAIAIAAVECAWRLEGRGNLDLKDVEVETEREVVLSVVDDLLEIYTNHSAATTVGPKYKDTAYLNTRIELNRERRHLANGHNRNRNGVGGRVDPPISVQLQNMAERGNNGTIRFMIDPEREGKECNMLEGSPDGGMGKVKVPSEAANGVMA